MAGNSVVMKVLLEICLASILLSYGQSSSRAATAILVSAGNDTETEHATTTTTIPNNTEVPAILDKPRVSVNDSSKSGTDSDIQSNITDKMRENNLIAPTTVNKVLSMNVTEKSKNTNITNTPSTKNALPSARSQQAESLDKQNSPNSPLTAESLDMPNSPLTAESLDMPNSPLTDPPKDFQDTSANETEEYHLGVSSLSTVATALEEDKAKDATSLTLPPELIFIIVLLSLALLEVGLVNTVNWWKARDGSPMGQRRSILSLLRLGLCKKTNNATYVDPLDDTTPIIPDV